MGSCANGGGYYHYSYSVVRGCDRELIDKDDSEMVETNIHGQGLCPLTYTFPGARPLLRRFYTGCCNFNER
jgi:hypothetical protein